MAGWIPITFGGATYNLSHLDAFVMPVTPAAQGAPTYRVLVDFSHHTFSRDVRAGDPPDMIVHHKKHQNDPRCFCTTRHGLSSNLPAIVRSAATGRAFFGKAGPGMQNYFVIENLPGLASPYGVFFVLSQARAKNLDVIMFVTSAYEKQNWPPNSVSLTFATLIGTVAAGKPVIKPKK